MLREGTYFVLSELKRLKGVLFLTVLSDACKGGGAYLLLRVMKRVRGRSLFIIVFRDGKQFLFYIWHCRVILVTNQFIVHK